MIACGSWETISAEDYYSAFARFGGSFAVHPRVVALVASLAKRPVRYVGLARNGELVAAVPLWGKHIVASKLALEFYCQSHLIDVGDQEVVLPIAPDSQISLPFMAHMISSLHESNILNVEREPLSLTLAKGRRIGDHRQSPRTVSKRQWETRRFQDSGGRFYPVDDLSAEEVAAIYTGLYNKRRGTFPQGNELLPTVLRELKDLLSGDLLYFNDRPVSIELLYKHETPRWLFANNVQRGFDPEFRSYSVGSISLFHNIGKLEEEAVARNRVLRYNLGWNDASYKTLWTFEIPAYRLAPQGAPEKSIVTTDFGNILPDAFSTRDLASDTGLKRSDEQERYLRGNLPPAEAERNSPVIEAGRLRAEVAAARREANCAQNERDRLRQELDSLLGSTFWRATQPARQVAAVLPVGLRRHLRRTVKLLYWIATPHRTRERVTLLRSRRKQGLAARGMRIPEAITNSCLPPNRAGPSSFEGLQNIGGYEEFAGEMLRSCAEGTLSAHMLLFKLCCCAPNSAAVSQVLEGAIGHTNDAECQRLLRAYSLWCITPNAFDLVREVGHRFNNHMESTEGLDPLARIAGAFDAASELSPEGSVALYSLGREDVLEQATAEVVDFLRSQDLLDHDRTALEIGCGIGRFLAALAPTLASVVGVDVSCGMLTQARQRCERYANVELLHGDGRGFPSIPGGSINLVFAIDSFPYLVQAGDEVVQGNLEETYRVLRPEGRFLIFNYSYRGDDELDRRDVVRYAREIGFEVRRLGDRPFHSWDGAIFDLERLEARAG